MSKTRVLFVDRDGTLIEEPPDEQVDSIEKIRFMPGVFAALRQAQRAGYKLAMITNQDGLGSESFPQAAFDVPHQFMMDAFSSQDIEFDAVFVCPQRKTYGCDCRKPKTKLVEEYVRNVDLNDGSHWFYSSAAEFEKGKAKYQQWLEQERQKKREAEANQSSQ